MNKAELNKRIARLEAPHIDDGKRLVIDLATGESYFEEVESGEPNELDEIIIDFGNIDKN